MEQRASQNKRTNDVIYLEFSEYRCTYEHRSQSLGGASTKARKRNAWRPPPVVARYVKLKPRTKPTLVNLPAKNSNLGEGGWVVLCRFRQQSANARTKHTADGPRRWSESNVHRYQQQGVSRGIQGDDKEGSIVTLVPPK